MGKQNKKKSEKFHHFGERLRFFRKKRGFSQTKLGLAVGASVRVISYYENECPFTAGFLINKVADVLQISEEDLVGTKHLSEYKERPFDSALIERICTLQKMPAVKKRTLNRIIDAYLEEFKGKK